MIKDKSKFFIAVSVLSMFVFGAFLWKYIADKPEREFFSYFKTIICDSAELEYCRLISHKSAVVVYSVHNETGFLADSLKVRKLFEKYIQEHMQNFSDAEIKLQFSFRNGHVSAYYYNYDHINYNHIPEAHHCNNTYDLHYAEISDNYNDSLSVLQHDTDLEYLSLSGMKDYDLSFLRDFNELKEVTISAPNSAEKIKNEIDISVLPKGCNLWIEAEKIN